MNRFNLADFLERHDRKPDERFVAAAQIIEPHPSGPWIVGGSVRRLLDEQKQDSDFDVAFADAGQLETTQARLEGLGFEVKRKEDAHVELVGQIDKKPARIQLLRITFAATPDAILDSFDFTICQFAYDGTDIIAGPWSMWDLARKKIALHKVTFAASSVRRLTKYAKQGYQFCQGTIVAILEAVAKNPALTHAEIDYVD